MSLQPDIAVISGDLIRSSALSAAAYQQLIQTLTRFFADNSSAKLPQGSLFRGDGFQLLCPAPELVNTALRLRLTLQSQGADARLSLARGPVEQLAETLASSRGSALTLAGHQLDKMRGPHWLAQDLIQPLNKAEQLLLWSCSVQLCQLTARQAKVLLHYFASGKPSHQQLASSLGVSRANITQLLNQAQYDLISEIDDYFATRHLQKAMEA